jgi:hypothetical protein
MEENRLQLLENGALLKALGVRGRKEGRKEGNVPYRTALLFAILAKYYRGDQIRGSAIGGGLCGKNRG